MSYIYLASPYSQDIVSGFEEAKKATVWHLVQSIPIFSPIVHCHELAHDHDLPKDFKFWRRYALSMLAPAAELRVLEIAGWQTSVGVQEEIRTANTLSIPITRMRRHGTGYIIEPLKIGVRQCDRDVPLKGCSPKRMFP